MVEAVESVIPLPCFQFNEVSVDSGVVPNTSLSVTLVPNLSPLVSQFHSMSPSVTPQVNLVAPYRNNRSQTIPRNLDMCETDLPNSLVSSTCRYPIHSYISTRNLATSYRLVVSLVTALVEPTTYSEAYKYEAQNLVMQTEITALESIGTWVVFALPTHAYVIICKCIYKIKLKA